MLTKLSIAALVISTLAHSPELSAQVVAQETGKQTPAESTKLNKADLIKELMKLMEVEKQFTSSNEQMINSFPNPFAQEFGSEQAKFDKIYKKNMTKTMTEQMKKLSAKLMPKISKLYESGFTIEELQQLVDFHKSPAGIKQQKLAPKMMKETMTVIQSGMEKDIGLSYEKVLTSSLEEAKKQKINPEKVDALLKQQADMKKSMAAPAA